jgi:hypothetical protein
VLALGASAAAQPGKAALFEGAAHRRHRSSAD